ncbi:hypothetical protein ARAM_007279 [Aspergillus rambellii]|uniref:RecQ-mediated genome instability protein 1 n=1 Tax=Aspergillus rambellii TaxID=308745 RepID=A0A0F8VVE2_9EURO|nr:hypothetical protein ARAM_007279 [Aspergillus rambellii]
MSNQQDHIAAHLLSSKSLPVSPTWLLNFLSSSSSFSSTSQRNIPISALTQTALFRILNSDFRQSLVARNDSTVLPTDAYDPHVQERCIRGPIPVQVLDIEDIGTSLWNQVEEIERVERGEAIRGREIVRTVTVGEENQDSAPAAGAGASDSHGPHRLIIQDAAGTRAVAIEMQRVNGIAVNKLPIGAKLLLRNVTAARGMILLTPENVTILGGKIDSMDQAWKLGRKARLLEKVPGPGGDRLAG